MSANKRNSIWLIAAVIAAGALFFAYRGYRDYREELRLELDRQRQLTADNLAAQQAEETERLAEARRMAEALVRDETERTARQLETLKQERAAAETARQQAEAEADRLAVETARLQAEKEAALAEARRLATLRSEEAARAESARQAALAKLQRLEEEQARAEADRQAARAAALQAQRDYEARRSAFAAATPSPRYIYPADYKLRGHYNFRSIREWETYRQELRKLEQAAPQIPVATDK